MRVHLHVELALGVGQAQLHGVVAGVVLYQGAHDQGVAGVTGVLDLSAARVDDVVDVHGPLVTEHDVLECGV